MILMIDDEQKYVQAYIDDMMEAFEVVFEDNVDAGFATLQERLADIDLLILDIMMPAGKHRTSAETSYGLRTGLSLYKEVRQLAPRLPIVVLTNVNDAKLEAELAQPLVWFYQKDSILPDELRCEIETILAAARHSGGEGTS